MVCSANDMRYFDGTLYWITGLSGAGKTTIGNRLFYELRREKDNVVLLDGDRMKDLIGSDLDYSRDSRRIRAMRYARLCKMLTDQGIIVICCTIAMFDEVRCWNKKNNKKYVEIFLNVPMETLVQRDQKGLYSSNVTNKNLVGVDITVEYPKNPDIEIVNDGRYSIRECVEKILAIEVNNSTSFDRDTAYWNEYYGKRMGKIEPSNFAIFVGEELKRGRTLLELGCGNGRDSLYFHTLGLNVTGIDASSSAICALQEKFNDGNICFICDDFVSSPMIYTGQFDYCYARFSLHAISEEQENDLLRNVYNVLKNGNESKFFIEVRSVHDDLYGRGTKVADDSYVYEGHFRRFVDRNNLEEKLKYVGFNIVYSEEKKGFAPFEGVDPPVIRIVAQKA